MLKFALSRRELVAAAPFAALASVSLAHARPTEPALAFVAVGDWGRNGASHQRDVAAQMGRAAADVGSRFVVSTGDNFYEDGVESAQDPKWRSSFEEVYTAPALQTPWYAVLGNHDYRGAPQAEIDYAVGNKRWRMPSRYYKVAGSEVSAPHVDLFFIDTSPLVHKYRTKVHSKIAENVASQDVAAQLEWLDSELAKSRATWKLVFGHHTIYSGGSDHGNTVELVEQVKPILERRGVNAYFNGHEHDLQHIRVGTVDYICTGAGSSVRPTGRIEGTRFALSRSGFTVVRVGRETLDLEFRDYTGASVYRTAILPARQLQAA